MSTQAPHQLFTYAAGADLSAKKFWAVTLSTSAPKTVVLAANGKDFIGVIESAGTTDKLGVAAVEVRTAPQNVTVATAGRLKGVAQAAITVGAKITVHTDGRFRIATSGETFIGIAEEAAAAAGDYFTFICTSGGVV